MSRTYVVEAISCTAGGIGKDTRVRRPPSRFTITFAVQRPASNTSLNHDYPGIMTSAFQASLFDSEQDFGLGEADRSARISLADGAWLDVVPGWLRGADALFEL